MWRFPLLPSSSSLRPYCLLSLPSAPLSPNILLFPTSRSSNPPLNIVLETHNSRGSFYLSLTYSRSPFFPRPLHFSLFLSFFLFSTVSESSFLLSRCFSSLPSHSFFSLYFSILFRSVTSPNTSFASIFVLILPPRRRDTLLQDSRNRKMSRSCGLYRCKWTLLHVMTDHHISRPVNSGIQQIDISPLVNFRHA